MNRYFVIEKKLNLRKETLKVKNSFGSTFKLFRKTNNITLAQAAENICSISYLSKVENNLINISNEYIVELNQKFKLNYLQEDDFNNYNTYMGELVELITNHEDLIIKGFVIKSKDHHAEFLKFIKLVINKNFDEALDIFTSLIEYLDLFTINEMDVFQYLVVNLLDKVEKYYFLSAFVELFNKYYETNAILKLKIAVIYLKALMEIRNHRNFSLIYDGVLTKLINNQMFKEVIEIQKYNLDVNIYHLNEKGYLSLVDKQKHLTNNEKNYFKAKYYYNDGNYELAKGYVKNLDDKKSYILNVMIDCKLNVFHDEYMKLDISDSKTYFLIILYLNKQKQGFDQSLNFFNKRVNSLNALTEKVFYLEFFFQEAILVFKKANMYKNAQKISENYQALLKDML